MSKTRPPRESRYAKLSPKQRAELDEIEREAVLNFRGPIDELERAIGMLRIGHHFGWRVLVIAHSKRTIRKYEEILGIKFREVFPAEGPSTSRSYGFTVAQRLENFWKAVSGETKVPDRMRIEQEPIEGT